MFRNLKVTIYGGILPNSRIVSYYLHLKEYWQLLTDESAFVGSSREAPAHHQKGKNKSNLRLGKFQHGRKIIVLHLCHPSVPDFLEGKSGSAMCDTVNRSTSFSPYLNTEIERWERQEEHTQGSWEGIKRMQILLNVLWTPSGSLLMSYQDWILKN